MSTHTGDATADLFRILQMHCPQTAASTAALTAGGPGLNWRPVVLGDIPGVSEFVGLVSPPVKVAAAFLKVISGILDIIQKLLLALPDPIKAIITAAYDLLKTIVDDFLATGAYLYVDIPGLLSNRKTLNDMGAEIPEPPQWVAGNPRVETPKPAEGFAAWSETFVRSFDDAGDEHRPVFSDGAPVEALFLVATMPNMVDFTKFAKHWGKLLNLKEFEKIVDEFEWKDFDLDKERTRGRSIAPDWRSWKLRDIGPEDYPLRVLEKVPEILLGILENAENLIETLGKLVKAIQNKVKVLEEFVALIDKVIDILRALSAAGLHALPVVTTEGVQGLKKAFLEAGNRPDGVDPVTGEPSKATAIMGACFMTGSSGVVPLNPQLLWALLGQGKSFDEAYAGTIKDFNDTYGQWEDAWDDTKAMASEAWQGAEGGTGVEGKGIAGLWDQFAEEDWQTFKGDMAAYFDSLPAAIRDDINRTLGMLGLNLEEADALFRADRNAFMGLLEQGLAQSTGTTASPMVMGHLEATRRARRRGARAMAAAAAAGVWNPGGGG